MTTFTLFSAMSFKTYGRIKLTKELITLTIINKFNDSGKTLQEIIEYFLIQHCLDSLKQQKNTL